MVNFTLIVVRSGKEHASPPSICDVKCLLDLSYLLFEVLFSVLESAFEPFDFAFELFLPQFELHNSFQERNIRVKVCAQAKSGSTLAFGIDVMIGGGFIFLDYKLSALTRLDSVQFGTKLFKLLKFLLVVVLHNANYGQIRFLCSLVCVVLQIF